MNYAFADGILLCLEIKNRSWKLFTSSDKDKGRTKLKLLSQHEAKKLCFNLF